MREKKREKRITYYFGETSVRSGDDLSYPFEIQFVNRLILESSLYVSISFTLFFLRLFSLFSFFPVFFFLFSDLCARAIQLDWFLIRMKCTTKSIAVYYLRCVRIAYTSNSIVIGNVVDSDNEQQTTNEVNAITFLGRLTHSMYTHVYGELSVWQTFLMDSHSVQTKNQYNIYYIMTMTATNTTITSSSLAFEETLNNLQVM